MRAAFLTGNTATAAAVAAAEVGEQTTSAAEALAVGLWVTKQPGGERARGLSIENYRWREGGRLGGGGGTHELGVQAW